MPYIKHHLGKTFYLSKGRSNGVPLIALHGGPGGSSEMLKPLLDLPTPGKKIIYDQIGGGKSSLIASSLWKIETFVEELETLIKKQRIDRFDLFGGSWGTTLALEYYLRKKGKGIRSLIFQSPMFCARDWENDGKRLISSLPEKTKKVIRYCHEIGATDSKVYQEAMFTFYNKHVLRNKKKLKALFSKPGKFNQELYEYMWGPSEFKPTGSLKKYDRVSQLKRIKVPTLILCGQYDEARPATGKRYSRLIDGAQFIEIKGCSHAILAENKEALLKPVAKFLNNFS